jgi:hypothetical protein
MAATNYTPIQLYYSTTASAAPAAGNLVSGELAINITDGKLYYKDNGGVVQVIATKGTGTIGGSTTQVQYNNAGALAGSANFTFNGTTATINTLNLTNALGTAYGGTAQSAYAQGDLLYASAVNTLSKLSIGTVNYILTSTGSVPQWVAPTSVTVQTANNLAGGAAGSVPYQSAADTTVFLAIGAANRVMTSTGSAPQWVTSLTGLTGVSSSSISNTGLTSGRVVYSGASGVQTDSANLTFNGTTLSAGGFSTTGNSTLVKLVTIGDSGFTAGAVLGAATPAKLYVGTGAVTDGSSAGGATNTLGAVTSFDQTQVIATNANVTYTNLATLYIAGTPTAGTNVTITNPYSLYIAGGASYFGASVLLNTLTASKPVFTDANKNLTSSGTLLTDQGGTGLTAFTAGDITYYASGTALSKLAIGTNGQILTSTGTAPQWSTLSGVAVTTFSAGTTGFTPNTATSGAITLAGTLNVTNGGTGLTSLTAGSLVYGAGASAFSTLAIGTNGQILTSSGTAPQWTTLTSVAVTTLSFGSTGLTPSSATSGTVTVGGTLITSNGGTGLSSYTAGDLTYYASGTALTKLGIGAANRVLTSSGSAPQWSASLTGLTSVSATSFTENGYAVVSQADIGTADNEIPLNQYLGTMAYQDGTNYFNTGMTVGYRNRLINGAMMIDQRNAGASTTPTSDSTYTLDRWICRLSQASKFSVQQVSTAPSNFTNSLKVTSLSAYSVGANDYFSVGQRIEGLNVADLGFGTSSAKNLTLSFWVYSSLTGTFSGGLANSGYGRNFAFTYTVNSANTWEQKTINISGDTSGTWLTTSGIGLILQFSLGAGSNYSDAAPNGWSNSNPAVQNTVSVVGTNGATWLVTGVQVEVGTQATPFDWRPFGTELQLCQRYYEKSFNLENAPANGANSTSFATGAQNRYRVDWSAAFTAGTVNSTQMFIVPKRATPTITQYGNSSGEVNVLNFTAGTNTWNAATSTPFGQLSFYQYTNTGFGTNEWGLVFFNFAASAEL